MIIQFTLLFIGSLLMFMFPLVSHPLMMGLIILGLTILISASFSLMSVSTWPSYALILILLGGLLVIFVYVSLLAPNENQKTLNMKKIAPPLFLLGGVIYLSNPNFTFWVTKKNAFKEFSHDNEGLTWLTMFYSEDLGALTVFLVLYLFLTLIVVVFISKTTASSLRAN